MLFIAGSHAWPHEAHVRGSLYRGPAGRRGGGGGDRRRRRPRRNARRHHHRAGHAAAAIQRLGGEPAPDPPRHLRACRARRRVRDLAVLRIHPDGLTLHPLPLGSSSAVQVGDPVLAIGNPFDLQRTLTTGVVSALQRTLRAPNGFTITNVIQTDAPINPGNSGGPLLDASGRVIGINSQIYSGSNGGGSIGIGFAVPIDTAKNEIAQLEKGGTVRGAYIGLTSITIDGSLAALNLPVKSGALVQSVQKGAPAERAGIHGGNVSGNIESGQVAVGGDIITSINGQTVNSSEDLANDISSKKPGDTVTVGLLRATGGGRYEKKTVRVTLASRPSSVPEANSSPEG